jgi:hypothetical protein
MVSGLNYYLVMLRMDNTGVKAVQFLGNMDKGQVEIISHCEKTISERRSQSYGNP